MDRATITGLAADLVAGRASSRALVDTSLARIDAPEGEGARTFIRRFTSQALAAAKAADAMREAGLPAGPLAGLPVSVKDLCDVAGSVTTAGSRVLRDEPPAQRDAPVVARLRAAGAIIVGTTNMTEFAMGGVGINPHFGTPRNPWDRRTGRIPGGSSSGAAISVTDGMSVAAIGSDTAGSIQMPAALCGLVGFKPTARRVPLEGTIPLAMSLDSIGPLANSVDCCARVDAVLAGVPDEQLCGVPADRLTLGVPQTVVLDDLEPDVARAFERVLSTLSAAGVRIVDIVFPQLGDLPKIAFSVVEGYAWHRKLLAERQDRYDPIVARRFLNGAAVGAADYIDLLGARRALIQASAMVTRDFDALLMPTVPIVAPRLDDFTGNEEFWLATNRRLIRNPGIANFLDRCGLSIPCHEPGAAPVGISLMGEWMGDRRLLAVGLTLETLLRGRTS